MTGCSGGSGGTGGGTGGSASGTTSAAALKTYTEQDLVAILTKANTALQAGGTVTDIGLLAAAQSDKTKSLPQRVKDQGGTFTPAECGPLFDKVTGDLLTLGGNNGAYSASLTYGTTVVSATSSAKPGNATELDKLIAGDVDSMNSKCSDMSFTFSNNGRAAAYHLSFAKQDVTTAAGTTHAYNEVTTAGAATVHTISGVVVDGNLLIGFAGISSATTVDDLTKAINAVHTAANG